MIGGGGSRLGRLDAGWRGAALLGAARLVIAFAVYAAAELLSTRVLGTAMPLWIVLLATAAVATLFWLIRRPLRRLVDQLVLGDQADGYAEGRILLRRMATTLAVDEIVPALAEAAGRTMNAPRAEVRLLLSDGDPWSQVWPDRAPLDGSPVTVDVRHAGAPVGQIEVDVDDAGESYRDRRLLDELARPAGLALSTVRLTVELRRRAADLQDATAQLGLSNQRIMDARRTEIARLRGEMEDRVLPHIDRAQAALAAEPTDGVEAAQGLELARTEVAAALDALRVLSRGIYPPRLADAGLAVSLEGWQQRSGVGIDLQVVGDHDALHCRTDVESCVYFSVVTALAAVPGTGRRPAVHIEIGQDQVAAMIASPTAGRGAAPPMRRALVAVRDRVEAFDGTVEWRVGPGEQGADAHPNSADAAGSPGAAMAVIRLLVPMETPQDGESR